MGVERHPTLKRRRMLATMMDTELDEAPMTPTTRSGLVMMGGPPLRHLTSVLSFSMSACTKVSDCSRAWVSREHVSRMRAPSVMLGSSSLSLLMRSSANSIASSRWMPFSFFSSPQALPSWPRACTGNRPPREMSPSMRMELRCVWPGARGLVVRLTATRGKRRRRMPATAISRRQGLSRPLPLLPRHCQVMESIEWPLGTDMVKARLSSKKTCLRASKSK